MSIFFLLNAYKLAYEGSLTGLLIRERLTHVQYHTGLKGLQEKTSVCINSLFYQYLVRKNLNLSWNIFITACKYFIITSLCYVFDLLGIATRESHKQMSEWYHL